MSAGKLDARRRVAKVYARARRSARRNVVRQLDRVAVSGATDRPVFVGASPRSGTTLLRTILNSHPDFAMPRESRFLLKAYQRRDEFGDFSEETNRRAFAEWVVRGHGNRTKLLELDAAEAIDRMVAAPPSLGSMLAVPFAMYAENAGASRWGDKRPAYVRYTGRVFSLYPDAQFVNVVRDPRASVASMLKLGWFNGSVPRATELWVRSAESAAVARGELLSSQFIDLRYEDLIGDTPAAVTGLATSLGLDSGGVGEMLSYYEDNDVPEGRYHWRVSQPPDASAATAWRESLTPDQVSLVEWAARDHMEHWEYERIASGPPPAAAVAEYDRLRKRRSGRADGHRRVFQMSLLAADSVAQRRLRALARSSGVIRGSRSS